MTPEQPINIPPVKAIGILSETEGREDDYGNVVILGIVRGKRKGEQLFKLGLEKEGKVVKQWNSVMPARADDLRRYQNTLESLQKKD